MSTFDWVSAGIILSLVIIIMMLIGSGLFVVIAYSLGSIINAFLGFDIFQSTLLSLIGFIVVIELVIARPFLFSMNKTENSFDDDEDDDEDDNEDDNGRAFSRIHPDQPCSCGSGRRYKNCCGSAYKQE